VLAAECEAVQTSQKPEAIAVVAARLREIRRKCCQRIGLSLTTLSQHVEWMEAMMCAQAFYWPRFESN